jgi:hypothetical protein
MDGTIELTFSDCNHGQVAYDIPSVDRQGVIPIQRISFENSAECESRIDAVPEGSSRLTARNGGSRTEAAVKTSTVQAPGDSVPGALGINPGLNDAWFNPATAGQGFFVNVFPSSSQLFLAWFTFETSRPPANTPAQLAEAGHRWVTSFGDFSGDAAELDIEVTTGGVFDSATPMTSQVNDGTMSLTFENCNAGTISYNIPSIGRASVVPIQRIGDDSVPNCEVANTGGQPDNESLVPENRTEVANLCIEEGGTIWEFDWPDEEGAMYYELQIFRPDSPIDPRLQFQQPHLTQRTQQSHYNKPLLEGVDNDQRIGWTWRYGTVGPRTISFSELFTFDVRPEENPCLD